MRKDCDNRELTDFLNNIAMPDVQTPLHKKKLKNALLNSEHLYRNPAPSPLQIFSLRFPLFVRKHGAYSLAAIAIFLIIAVLNVIPFTSPALAHIVFEVNPTMKLTVDSRNNVIAFEALDQTAIDMFDEINFRGKSTELAIEEIISRLHEQSSLEQDNRMLLLVYPAKNKNIDDIAQTLSKAESTANRRLSELNAQAQFKTFALQSEVYIAAEQAGLAPSQYARLLEYEMTSENLIKLIHQADEPEVDKEYFVDHFDEIADQVTKVLAKDVSESEAVLVVREALAARRGTGELRKAVQRLNEFIDEDLTPKEAIVRVREEMRSRRNLNDIDDKDTDDEGNNEYIPKNEDTDQKDERRQRREERQERLNERQNQQDEKQKQQDSEDDEQTSPDEEPEQDIDRQERLNEREQRRNERQEQRNEMPEEQNEHRQRRNARQQQQYEEDEKQNDNRDQQNERRENRHNRQRQKEEKPDQSEESPSPSNSERLSSDETTTKDDLEE